MEDRLENNYEETDEDQHLAGRERHLAMATDVVAHQIARTPQQLNERIGERAGVQSPEDGDVVLDDVLMTIDIMRFGLLPAAETVVIRYYLTLISFDKSQFFWLRCL